MTIRAITLLSLWAAAVSTAQDVGMGRRTGSGARMEAPYRLDVETPHVKWARPLRGGAIKILAVPSVSEGRTLIELAQRVSLDFTTVSIDERFDASKWTMAFGRDYGARAERGDFSLLYGYLEEELTSSKQFDVILLPVHHTWQHLTAKSREALLRRVQDGAGLVLIHPTDTEISPLLPDGSGDSSSEWKRTRPHYITAPIPVESFPFKFVSAWRYKAAPDATVLVADASGAPVVAVREHGKGRVVAFGYRNDGMSWRMPMNARGFVSQETWEAFYAMLCRALLFAARREGDAPADWKVSLPPPPGTPVEQLAVSRETLSEGDSVEVTWQAAKPVDVEITDGFERVIARGNGANKATLRLGRPLTHSGFVTVGAARIPVRFASRQRAWTDYEVIMPWYGPGSYQPWIPALDEQFRSLGITALARPERNFKIIASAGLHDVFGVYAYRNQKYSAKKAAYAQTRDTRHLTRDVVLQDPDFDTNLRHELERSLKPIAPLKPLAYYLADESSLTSYTDPFDVDWAPSAIAGLRTWLKGEYKSLDALNASWGTSFKDWDSVLPMTTEQAQKHGNYAPWADHRTYMEQEFVQSLRKAREMVKELDPGAPASISGTQVPTAHNGVNWYRIDQIIDYLQPYSGGNQDPMHHLFRPGILLTGFTGYGLTGAPAHHQQWQRLFYGHTGASIFWHYTILNPDLTFSAQGEALAAAFGKIQSGIGRVFMNSRVREDGVAIHFSMPSIRGAWIQDGVIRERVGNVNGTSKNYVDLVTRRDQWVKALEKQGVQFRFLATEQIEAGELGKFKVLILPYSIALSDKEIAAIHSFIKQGGIVYSDEQTGRMDERCHWRKPAVELGERRAPGPVPVEPAFRLQGDYLVTVRDFGQSRLIGALTNEAATVTLPATSKVRYDLLRGRLAPEKLETSPEAPILLVERDAAISKLALSPALDVTLTDAKGQPVDRSVVRIEVFSPNGRLQRHYSGNVTVQAGKAKYNVPFALSDALGTWRVRARDVISGLTAETVIRR